MDPINEPPVSEGMPTVGARPSGYAGVWPPPIHTGDPTTDASLQQMSMRFDFLYNRVTGNISDVREGHFGLSPQGIWIVGKSMPRSEIYSPIVIVLVILSFWLAIIAHCIMRYATLQPTQLFVPWTDITKIVLVPNRRRIGIAYNAPNYKGTIKSFCLCASLALQDYALFAQMAETYAPAVTAEGKLKSGTSPVLWIALLVIVLLVAGLFTWLVMNPAVGAR